MTNYIKIFLSLLVCNTGLAQIAVKGKVSDTNGEPVFGATVSFYHTGSSTKGGTVTDMDGHFRFETSETGNYQVTVSYIGLKTLSIQKSFDQVTDYDLGTITLQENVEQLQSVEVIGRPERITIATIRSRPPKWPLPIKNCHRL